MVVPQYEITLLQYLAVVQPLDAGSNTNLTNATDAAASAVVRDVMQAGRALHEAAAWFHEQVLGSDQAQLFITLLAG